MAIAIVEELWARIRAAIDDKIVAAEDAASSAATSAQEAANSAAGAAAALSTKADVVHTHTSVDITDASVTATANAVVKRDASARAKFANPAAAQDAATKAYVDTGLSGKAAASHTHTSADITDTTSGVGTSDGSNGGKLVKTTDDGRLWLYTSSITEPSHVVNKDYVDTGLSGKAAASHTHTSADISDRANGVWSDTPAGRLISTYDDGFLHVSKEPMSNNHVVNKLYADNLVDWDNTIQHRLWGHVPFVTDDGISVTKVWLSSEGDYAASKGYVDTVAGTESEVTMTMWGATWYFTKVGRTVFVSTNGASISTASGRVFTTAIPEGYRPKYEVSIHFGQGTQTCKIPTNGLLTSPTTYAGPVSFQYLAA